MKETLAALAAAVLAGCAGPGMESWESSWEMEPISFDMGPMWGYAELRGVEAEDRYDVALRRLQVDVEGALVAGHASDATLDVYLMEWGCPARYGPGADEPETWLDHAAATYALDEDGVRRFAFSERLEGRLLPGAEWGVLVIADAHSLFETYECLEGRADPLDAAPRGASG